MFRPMTIAITRLITKNTYNKELLWLQTVSKLGIANVRHYIDQPGDGYH